MTNDAVSRKAMKDKVEALECVLQTEYAIIGFGLAKNAVISAIESLPSILSPAAETAEGRYRYALEEALLCWTGRGRHESASDVLKEMLVIIRQALSPSYEQPGPRKSTMVLMTKEEDGE